MSTRSQRRVNEEEKGGKMGKTLPLAEKRSASWNGTGLVVDELIQRKKTDSELLLSRTLSGGGRVSTEMPPRRPTKLLLNVTLERSLGAVHVVMSPELKVGDLVAAVVRQYVKEGRRPFLVTNDPAGFNLHYSQFSLECLEREEKLLTLGSRNFFMCPNKDVAGVSIVPAPMIKSTSSFAPCSNQVEKASKIAIPWLKLMDFLM